MGTEATLTVLLQLKDQLSSGIATAESKLGGLTTKVGGLSGLLGKVEGAAGRMGGALSHAGSQISGLVSGPLAMLMGGAGLLSLGGLISSSTSKMEDLALSVEQVTGVTKMSAQEASAMIAVFGKFGVDASTTGTRLAFMEKTIGNLTLNSKAYSNFVKEFGFTLKDVHGNVLDTQTAFEKLADYWTNNSIPASERAALAAKLLGRGYLDLVPICNQGSAGIQALEQQATDLGLVLDQSNMQQVAQYRDSMRSLGEAVGGLQLQIGLALAPAISGLAESMTTWISHGGAQQVAQWFRDGAKFAQDMGKVIQDDLLPPLHAIMDWWSSLPDDVKKIIVGGLITQKASSWLFGGGGIAGALTSVLKVTVGGLFGTRGTTPANPLWVADVTGGGGGKVPGVPTPSGPEVPPVVAGGASILPTLGETALLLPWFSAIIVPAMAMLLPTVLKNVQPTSPEYLGNIGAYNQTPSTTNQTFNYLTGSGGTGTPIPTRTAPPPPALVTTTIKPLLSSATTSLANLVGLTKDIHTQVGQTKQDIVTGFKTNLPPSQINARIVNGQDIQPVINQTITVNVSAKDVVKTYTKQNRYGTAVPV